ncbi:MAG: PHP domain-containing protein, partial [Planctomycetaceae bacterium]
MPDNDRPKVPRPALRVATASDAAIPFAELRCKSNFSFLTGASHPDELVQRAADLSYRALAVTDVNSLAGVVRAHVAAKQLGLKLLIGAELIPQQGPNTILLAKDREAYARLSQLLTLGRRRAPKGECHLHFDDIAQHAEGLLSVMPLEFGTGCAAQTDLQRHREVFGDRCYALLSLPHGPNDRAWIDRGVKLAEQANVPLVASNDVYYHAADRRYLHDVVTAIRHRCAVAELGSRRFPNGERYLKSPAQLQALFADVPEA